MWEQAGAERSQLLDCALTTAEDRAGLTLIWAAGDCCDKADEVLGLAGARRYLAAWTGSLDPARAMAFGTVAKSVCLRRSTPSAVA